MKIKKFIHGLLILALAYGQLVANVHGAGHLHTLECAGTINPATEECADHHHGPETDHSHATDHQHTSEHTSNDTTNRDCGIYHALLGLHGVERAEFRQYTVTLQYCVKSTCASRQFSCEAPNEHHIRAPPFQS